MARASAISGGVLRRERLFALLDRAIRTGSGFVSGPPGSGKTTLVASYLESRRIPALWHRVHAGNADLASFFHDLAQRCPPRARSRLPSFTPEYRGGEVAFSRRAFRELARARRRPFALVLDDLHEVARSEAVFAALADGIQELGPGVTALLVSREEPPAALARLVGNGVMTAIPGEWLRLTRAEALAIARARAPGRARADLLKACDHAAGWAAGLVLLVSSPLGPESSPTEPSALFHYLASELFDRADAETQRILTGAAISPVLPVCLVNALCGSERAAAILSRLERRAYFVVRRRDADPAFELHPLVRDFLLSRAGSVRSSSEVRRMRARAAEILEREGYLEHAASLFIDAGSWPDAKRIALENASAILATGRGAVLAHWLTSLPEETSEQDPWVPYWLGECHLPFARAEARRHLERAHAGFERTGDVHGLFASCVSMLEAILTEWGDFVALDDWIGRLEALRSRGFVPSRELELRITVAMFAVMVFHRNDSPALLGWEERALEIVLDGRVPAPPRLMLGTWFLVESAIRGENARARTVMERIAPIAGAAHASPAAVLAWRSAEAVHGWHSGSPAKASEAVASGLELARESGVHAWDFVTLLQGVNASLAVDDVEGAQGFLARAEPLRAPNLPLNDAVLAHEKGLVALRVGDHESAVACARTALALGKSAAMPFFGFIGGIMLVLSAIATDDRQGARPHLDAARKIGAAIQSSLAEFLCDLCEAELARRAGDLESARRHVSRGFAIAREKLIAPDVWFTRPQLAELCALALEARLETEHAVALVRRLDLAAPESCHSDTWPWALRVRLLGEPELSVRGEPLRIGPRAQRRPLDVLAAVAIAGAHAPTADAVASTLWPDAEGDASHHALETALYRLRRLLGEDVVRQRDGTLVLSRARCWTDVAAFEALVGRAAASLQRRDTAGSLDAAAGAVALYRGPFLLHREEPWVLAARERLRARVRRCLSDLERAAADRDAVERLWARVGAADSELGRPAATNVA